ncbi:ankyrin repeat domain-containing protein [Desulfoluna limicola]|nr:ankyrin repeat domain-containing protein [Desulfoluna limicola]
MEKARLVVDVMVPAFKACVSGDFSKLTADSKYSGVVIDEENEEIRFEASVFFDATGHTLSGTVGREDARIHLGESWEDADRDVARVVQETLAFYHREEKTDEGVRVFFRHATLESKGFYYEVRLDIRYGDATPALTLGCYRKDRSRSTTVFTDGRTTWKTENTEVNGDGGTPSAGVVMYRGPADNGGIFGRHQLTVYYMEGVPWLSFHPQVYPMWSKGNPEAAEKGFIKELQGVSVDGKSLVSFERGAVRRPQFVLGSKQSSIPLNAQDLALLKEGEAIRFDFLTPVGEKMQVLFPLNGSMEAITALEAFEGTKPVTSLVGWVLAGDWEGLQGAIRKGISASGRGALGRSPLSLAVKMEDAQAIRILGKAQNLDREEKNSEGDGFLHIAAHYLHGTKVLRALLDIGCNPDSRDSNGRTPLSRTVCYEGFRKIDLLLKAGADINATDTDGYTPLHHTVRNRFSSADETAYLIGKGANKNKPTSEGNTPLMVAIDNQCWDHIKTLMDLDVSLSPKNTKGQNALAMAEAYRDSSDLTDMIPMLILAGDGAVKQTRESYKNLAEMIETKGFYFLGFKNSTSETVHVAIRLKDTDGDWVTRAWAKIEPGEKRLMGRSTNSIFYYFAESESWIWEGTDNTRTISGKEYGMRELKLDLDDRGEPYYHNLK